MAASAETLAPERSDPSEDWTIVLPRRGKRNKTVNKFVIPKRQMEVQLWAPVDLETDPERESKLMQRMESCIQQFENSKFYINLLSQLQDPDMLDKFTKVLGSEEKMQMVIYGIGSIESFEPPRLQLSLAILLKRSFDWIGGIELFDPIISLTESKVLTSLGCSVLSVNEQGRRRASKPTLFFMPHCEVELYDNLLEANWEVEPLSRLVIFGNSFGAYELHASLCGSSAVASSRRHVLAAKRFAEELRVETFSDDSIRAFHGTSWHFFGPYKEVGHAVARHTAECLTRNSPVTFILKTFLSAVVYNNIPLDFMNFSHSRRCEREADYIGLLLSAYAGYDPQMWKRYAKKTKTRSWYR